jgi:DNA-binding NarL/FixJ family response regulator
VPAFRVFVDTADPAMAQRVREDLSRTGWTIVARAADADIIIRPGGAAPPAAAGPAAMTHGHAWDGDAHAPVEALTPREFDVLRLLAEGAGNRAIGERLGISDHTVKFHLAAIFGKLGVTTRTAAVRRALRLGWIEA